MELKEFTTKEQMLQSYDLLHEFYPSLSIEDYTNELDIMIPNNYGQVVMIEDGEIIGLTAYWIGSKLLCGKYLECDNVVVSKDHRRKGIANKIFQYLDKKAREANCNMMALDSYRHNTSAHGFFENEGFDPRGYHFIKVYNENKLR